MTGRVVAVDEPESKVLRGGNVGGFYRGGLQGLLRGILGV